MVIIIRFIAVFYILSLVWFVYEIRKSVKITDEVHSMMEKADLYD